jgi:zinc/manganese transport system substrate-binding protein
MRRLLVVAASLVSLGMAAASAQTANVVAAENFYGDVASQVGGPYVTVTSILSNPDQDPHLFEASPSTARQIADARLVIFSGADYDPWMVKLLSASKGTGRTVIEVAKLVGKKSGDNPHIWYDPPTMPAVATAVAESLSKIDPAHRGAFAERAAAFAASLKPMNDKITALRAKYAGTPVTATEPVFGYMAEVLGFKMRNRPFQTAIMNDTEPSAAQIAAFDKDLKTRAVKVLLYNSQASGALTEKMQSTAKASGIPIVGVSETTPPGKTYQDWMMAQLDELERALARP